VAAFPKFRTLICRELGTPTTLWISVKRESRGGSGVGCAEAGGRCRAVVECPGQIRPVPTPRLIASCRGADEGHDVLAMHGGSVVEALALAVARSGQCDSTSGPKMQNIDRRPICTGRRWLRDICDTEMNVPALSLENETGGCAFAQYTLSLIRDGEPTRHVNRESRDDLDALDAALGTQLDQY